MFCDIRGKDFFVLQSILQPLSTRSPLGYYYSQTSNQKARAIADKKGKNQFRETCFHHNLYTRLFDTLNIRFLVHRCGQTHRKCGVSEKLWHLGVLRLKLPLMNRLPTTSVTSRQVVLRGMRSYLCLQMKCGARQGKVIEICCFAVEARTSPTRETLDGLKSVKNIRDLSEACGGIRPGIVLKAA